MLVNQSIESMCRDDHVLSIGFKAKLGVKTCSQNDSKAEQNKYWKSQIEKGTEGGEVPVIFGGIVAEALASEAHVYSHLLSVFV